MVIVSYASKMKLISVAAGIALITAYIIYATGAGAPPSEDVKAWAAVILVFIGIGIGLQIAVHILFHIALAIGIAVKEELVAGNKDNGKTAERIIEAEMAEDERSKIIDLKASRLGLWGMASGIVAALFALAIGAETVTALHILFGLTALASVAEGIAGVVYHERGVR